MKPQVEEVMVYKCNWCGELHNNEVFADKCVFNHAKIKLANTMLNKGYTLQSISWQCGFNWELSDQEKGVTKDNCFVIAFWQCCEKPAYQIIKIEYGGFLRLSGVGGRNGYSDVISIDRLPKPHPKEDLYIYP